VPAQSIRIRGEFGSTGSLRNIARTWHSPRGVDPYDVLIKDRNIEGERIAMKLAEALLLRADIQKKLASLQARAQRYAVVQEGEEPAEDPAAILDQVEVVADEFKRLVFAINRANLRHKIASGETLTEALAKRDSLVLRHGILTGVVDVCAKPPDRYGVKEIRWVRTVDVVDLQSRVDTLAKEIRELNAAIQQAGWEVELKS
jgi:methyl-accepting chemotaxis protein